MHFKPEAHSFCLKMFLNSHTMPLNLLCACLWVVEGSFGSIWSTNLQFVRRSFLLFLFGQGFVAVQIAVLHLPLRLYRHRCTVCPKKGSSSSSQFAVNDEGWEEGGGGVGGAIEIWQNETAYNLKGCSWKSLD